YSSVIFNDSRMAASSSMTRMRDLGMRARSATLDAHGLQLALLEVRRVDVQREHVARTRRARQPAVVRDRLDGLAVDFEEHRPALHVGIERGAERLDARDQHAARMAR